MSVRIAIEGLKNIILLKKWLLEMSRNVFLFLSKEATEEKRLISTPVRVNLNKKNFFFKKIK